MQNFRLLTAQKKFHQIYTLIGYFSESIYSVSKKSVEELCVMIPKSNSVHSLPLCRGVESPTKFSKRGGGGRGGLTGPQLLEWGCCERGDDFFQAGGRVIGQFVDL